MNIFLCAVDTRLARAWRWALPQTFGPAVAQVVEGDILFSARSFRNAFNA